MATMEETVRPLYDTLAAVRRLTEAGLPEPHAEAVVREQVHVMEHNLATKADIEKLSSETKADIEKLRSETKADIEKLSLETKADIEKLSLETKADIEKLGLKTEADIAKAKFETIKWTIAANTALVAAVIAAIKLLPAYP